MALNPQFAETIRTVRVDFGFAMFDCDPDEITSALGLVPDEIRRRGKERELRGGRRFQAPFSSWTISSKLATKDVNDHVRELLNRLDGCASRLDPRWGLPTFGVIYKATHLHSGNGPFFEADVVRGIASFGAELWQDLYALEEETHMASKDIGPVRRTLLRAVVWLPVLVVVLTIAVGVASAVLGDWLRPAEYR